MKNNGLGPGLEFVTIPQLAREIGDISDNGLRNVLKRHGITGDAVLFEGKKQSELFLRTPRVGQIKKLIESKHE